MNKPRNQTELIALIANADDQRMSTIELLKLVEGQALSNTVLAGFLKVVGDDVELTDTMKDLLKKK